MKYIQVFARENSKLRSCGEEAWSLSFAYMYLRQLSLTDFIVQMNQEVKDEECVYIQEISRKLQRHLPVQYLIGETEFCNLVFRVDKRVFIPRPETEELVNLVLLENKDLHLKVLDIGTGSGAIAISLSKFRKNWKVIASDISSEALDLANENARKHEVNVRMIRSDLFEHISGKFDIIISNPPYISLTDREEVDLNVLHSEPHIALFATENGLSFYRRIAEQSKYCLNRNGKIYLEIGYKQGVVVRQLFSIYCPNKRIRILQDSFNRDRMVVIDNYG